MDTLTSAQRIDVSPWELFMMNCVIPGLIPFLIDGEYDAATYNPARVARQFGLLDQGVP